MKKKQKKTIKTYDDEVELKLDGFDIQHLMCLLETEITESEDILGIKVALRLYEKLEDIFDKNWKH